MNRGSRESEGKEGAILERTRYWSREMGPRVPRTTLGGTARATKPTPANKSSFNDCSDLEDSTNSCQRPACCLQWRTLKWEPCENHLGTRGWSLRSARALRMKETAAR